MEAPDERKEAHKRAEKRTPETMTQGHRERIWGAIDTVVTDEDKLFRTVVSAFDGREINRERFEALTNRNDPEVRKALAKEAHHAKSPLNLR